MNRAIIVVGLGAVVVSGCASLIGASFDDAGLVEYDAALDVHEASLKFDVTDTKQFDPSSLPNLLLWLDAHQGIDVNDASTQVTAWHDQSGHPSHDAFPYPNYGIPTHNPTGINGQPSVHFESSSYQLLLSGFVGPGVTQFTFFVVTQGYPQSALRFQPTTGGFPVVAFPIELGNGGEQAPNLGFEIANSNTDYAMARALITSSATIATAILRATGTITTYNDGTLVEQRATTTKDSSQGATLFIGGLAAIGITPAAFAHGDIGEILVYSDALSDIDRSRVEEYLSVKWSIAL